VVDDRGVVVEVGGGHGPVVEGDDHIKERKVGAGRTDERGEGLANAPTVGINLISDWPWPRKLGGRIDEWASAVAGAGGPLCKDVESGEYQRVRRRRRPC
jgi:hypothetical protein